MSYVEGITEERDVKLVQAVCGAAIEYYRILQQQHGSQENVIMAQSGVQYPLGVSRDNSENSEETTYEADSIVSLAYGGIVYIKMNSSGYRHNRIMSGADGKGTKHVDTDDVYIIGNAMTDWNDGDIIAVLIDRYYVGDVTSDTGGN